MSDRSKARAFGAVFKLIAARRAAHDDRCSSLVMLAFDVWRSPERADFLPNEMDCDEALVALGLASRNRPDGVTALVEGPFRYATRDGEIKT